MKRRWTLLFFCLILSAQAFAELYIFTPKDEAVVFDQVVTLRGKLDNLKSLKVNDKPVPFSEDGSFSCGLVLNHGKNNVIVKAFDKDEKHYVKQLRVVRLKEFNDVVQEHWARNQIIYLATYGFIDAYPDGNFHPELPISRGDFAAWLAKVRRLAVPEKLKQDVFFDVPKELWAAPYIKAVIDAGYMDGYTSKIFGLNDPISRREAADIAVKSEGLDLVNKIKPLFEDVGQEEEGAKPIYTARKSGLVKGISDSMPIFDPDRAITRAEAATLFSRFERSVKSIKYLFDFGDGFGQYNLTKINISPKILYFNIKPDQMRLSQKAALKIRAKIENRTSFYPIATVWCDLSELGGPTNVLMYDDGTNGDEEILDNIYSINIDYSAAAAGKKNIYITVSDELGWDSNAETSLMVEE